MHDYDLFSEGFLTMGQAARKLPCRRQDKPTHPATLTRWATKGLHGVRLESVQVGGTRCTSAAALVRFFAALSGEPAPQRTLAQRERAIRAAERELDCA